MQSVTIHYRLIPSKGHLSAVNSYWSMVTVDSIQLEFCCSCLEGPKGWFGAVITKEDERPQMLTPPPPPPPISVYVQTSLHHCFGTDCQCLIPLTRIWFISMRSSAESIASCLIAFCSFMLPAYLQHQYSRWTSCKCSSIYASQTHFTIIVLYFLVPWINLAAATESWIQFLFW